ncbi:MAG: adenylate/guanylate cyclase domain-containing protein [Rhodospirillaceae bacterium]|nr:adenylate/guanylate cyclase domain-containing protein [Rhodospirillaceae bacterium]
MQQQTQEQVPSQAVDAAQKTFEYGSNPPPPAVSDVGIFDGWLFNMFAGAIDIQLASPILTLVYFGCLLALMFLRVNTDNPVRMLGCAGIYIYTTIQAYTLFQTNKFVLDYTTPGWQVQAKSVWFALLFTTVAVWGLSRVGQSAVVWLLSTGMGPLLRMINPLRLIDKLRSSDADLEASEQASDKDPKRQLTAIMFTDIVGYSKQMGANEAAMVKKLAIHNEIMRGQIVRNRGTVIKTIGDAFMVRFRSAESAVQCAMDCQKAIGEYNKSKTAEDQFHIRIGVHMGEVIHTTNDVFCEGVNIAARIEPKCDPDGVTVSDVVANAARNKVPAHFHSIGRHPMKNIANPPELFKVFPIEQQAAVKVPKGAAAPAGAGAPAPGGVFKI